MESVFVFGASGHGKVVVDILERQGLYHVAFLFDDDPLLKGRNVYGKVVLGGKEELLGAPCRKGIVAIGSNGARCRVAGWLLEHGFELVTALHPSAQIARGVTVGAGTVVMAGAVVNSDASLGSCVIVNTRAGIDHDCTIGDGVHLAPGSTLCGTVKVGERSFICAGSTVIPNITVGADVVVGAGATVIRDVPDGVTVVGSPAKIIGSAGQ